MRQSEVSHQFVDVVPEEPAEGIVYVSTVTATAMHLCLCGCGSRVTTPLDPSQWKLEFDGRAISLNPAIDNWTLDCRSHYSIRRNRIRWLARWSLVNVEVGRGY